MESFLEHFERLWLVWSVFVFLVIVAYAYWPRNGARFNDDAMIPLRDDDENEERKDGGNR